MDPLAVITSPSKRTAPVEIESREKTNFDPSSGYRTLKGLNCLRLVSSFIFCVHGDEPEHQQVQRRSNNSESEENEDEGEKDVLGSSIERIVFLQCDHIAEADCCEGNETAETTDN